jgi:hypothetical protein
MMASATGCMDRIRLSRVIQHGQMSGKPGNIVNRLSVHDKTQQAAVTMIRSLKKELEF